MNTLLRVRSAATDDLAQLIGLYTHLNPDDALLDLASAAHRLAQLRLYPGSQVFVGTLDLAVVTSCTLVVIPNLTRGGRPYALIENVVTHADHRGKGFGKQILKSAVAEAWSAGCYKVMLLTGSTQGATLSFYLSAGFKQSKTGFQMRAPS